MDRAILVRASAERAECDHRVHKACAASEDPNERAKVVVEIRKLVGEDPVAIEGFVAGSTRTRQRIRETRKLNPEIRTSTGSNPCSRLEW